MVVNDPISDFFTRVRNAALAQKREISLPASGVVENIAQVLVKQGYLKGVKRQDGELVLKVAYINGEPRITGVKNISRPGLHIYKKVKELAKSPPSITTIVSTSRGIMTGEEAVKKGLGGEVLAEVW